MITNIYCSMCIQYIIIMYMHISVSKQFQNNIPGQNCIKENSDCETAGMNKTILRLQWKVTHVS